MFTVKELPGSAKALNCPTCGRSFKRESGLRLHQQFNCCFFKCPRCQYRSVTGEKQLAHEAVCKGKKVKGNICHVCSTKFQSVKALRKHLLRDCGKTDIKCNYCKFKTKTRSYLMKHLWKQHPHCLELEEKVEKHEIENYDKNCEPYNLDKALVTKERGPPEAIPIALLYPSITMNQLYK